MTCDSWTNSDFVDFGKFRCDFIEKCGIIKHMATTPVILYDSRIGDALFLLGINKENIGKW